MDISITKKHKPNFSKSRILIGLLTVLLWFCFVDITYPQSKELMGTEYGIKAAYIFNFLKYIDWNEEKNPVSGDSIKIIVLGKYPFENAFDHLKGKTVRGKKLYILKASSIDKLSACNILYVSNSEQKNLKKILKAVKNTGALTVGETEDFTRQKGMIGFFMEDESVKFAINPELCESEGIKLNPQLLSIAKIVSYK